MPYRKNENLPENLRRDLPPHAQDIFRESFNNAWKQYEKPEKRRNPEESREAIAFKVAWSAVKKEYQKDSEGNWVHRERKEIRDHKMWHKAAWNSQTWFVNLNSFHFLSNQKRGGVGSCFATFRILIDLFLLK